MRCPDCNKFVSYDEQEPELSVDLQDGNITGSVRVVLPCAECGTELKEQEFDVDIDCKDFHDCAADEPEGGWSEDEEQFSLQDEQADFLTDVRTEYWDKKAKKYRPIKNSRYMTTYYGASLAFTVKCNRCEEEFEVTEELKDSASSFSELV